MSPTVQPSTGAFAAYEPTALPAGPILVATDASPDSDAAFPVAQVLAARTGAPVRVISVIRPFASSMYAYDLVPIPLEDEASLRAELEDSIRAQLARTIPSDAAWPLVTHTGEPAREITNYASAEMAQVIVAGRGRHGVVERVLAGETVLRLLQHGDTPVFAVEPGLTHLPRRVLIATDFSEYSLYAAQVALGFIAPDAMVYLIHVGPRFVETMGVMNERATAARAQAAVKLAEMHALLARDDLQFDMITLNGEPSEELIRFANEAQADLIVSATHGYGYLRRALLGSVASTLLRGAPCSVLCIPGSARTSAAAFARRAADTRTRVFPAGTIDVELANFTERNHRRHCTVTVHRSDLGAQVLGHSLPFVGATADEKIQMVSLMFGASQLTGSHLTHVLQHVTEVDVSTNEHGRDTVLRFVHDEGYTLVELE